MNGINWTSWHDFFAMGGYALYVWGSLIAVFGGLAAELLQLRSRTRAIRDEIAWSHQAAAHISRGNE